MFRYVIGRLVSIIFKKQEGTVRKPLYQPSEDHKKQANISKFISFINERYNLGLEAYDELYGWSVERIPDFWVAMWEFAQIKASRQYDEVVDDLAKFPGAKWFGGAKLNFAENLLRYRDDRTAYIFRGETRKSARMTYAELYHHVSRLFSKRT